MSVLTIDWNFSAEVPTNDFFESLDLDDPADVVEALENFHAEMTSDRFRTWEAIIRREQGLPCTTFLSDLADDLLNFGDEDDRVLYIDGMPRNSEPWYETLRKIAPRLLLEPFRTADVHYEGLAETWPPLVTAIENRGRGLSLPDDVSEPLDVLPAELRHKLSLQCCCDPLSGLGQSDRLTLAEEDQLDRIDWLIDELRAHRDSVDFLALTLEGLLQRVELPERDQPIFVRIMCEKLGLNGRDAPLAPHLFDKPTDPSDPTDPLPYDTIKQAVVHPDPAVREMAANYFADGFSSDTTIAPLVIQAISQYGRDDAFPTCFFLWKLAHTDETVAWMVRELQEIGDSCHDSPDYCMDLSYALSVVVPELLQPHRRAVEDLRQVAPDIYGMVLGRVEYQTYSSEELWKRFADFIAHPFDDYPVFPETEVLRDIAALLGNDERMVSWVLDTLARKVDDPQYNVWREGVAVQIAGELRLSAALSYLVRLLHDDEDDLNCDAMESLSQIGTDEVTAQLDGRYLSGYDGFRQRAATVLEDIHTERSIAALLCWHKNESSKTVRQRLLQALLRSFVPAAAEPARAELLSTSCLDSNLRQLRIELVALTTLTGMDFPELETWKKEAHEDYVDVAGSADEEDDWQEEDEYDEGDDADDADLRLADIGDRSSWPYPVTPTERSDTVINTGPKTGRNAPCPCGSGKKYKKCCLRK